MYKQIICINMDKKVRLIKDSSGILKREIGRIIIKHLHIN